MYLKAVEFRQIKEPSCVFHHFSGEPSLNHDKNKKKLCRFIV